MVQTSKAMFTLYAIPSDIYIELSAPCITILGTAIVMLKMAAVLVGKERGL